MLHESNPSCLKRYFFTNPVHNALKDALLDRQNHQRLKLMAEILNTDNVISSLYPDFFYDNVR